ncbi:mitochondrial ribosomal protein, partial [Ascodesmis nigricans]
RYLAPLRVLQTATRMLESGYISQEPVWFRAVAEIPPTTTIVRTPPVLFQNRSHKAKGGRKVRNLFKPQKIIYPEDELRQQFFKDHPWELARPRVLVENDGRDHDRYDWSNIQQRNKALDGESVVQRQMWLMVNKGMSQTAAYDLARKEFYDLRMQEDIERRIASEEAQATGAYFGKTYIDVGVELEGKVLEDWKEKATKLAMMKKGR